MLPHLANPYLQASRPTRKFRTFSLAAISCEFLGDVELSSRCRVARRSFSEPYYLLPCSCPALEAFCMKTDSVLGPSSRRVKRRSSLKLGDNLKARNTHPFHSPKNSFRHTSNSFLEHSIRQGHDGLLIFMLDFNICLHLTCG